MSQTLSICIFYYDSATNCNWIPHYNTVLPVTITRDARVSMAVYRMFLLHQRRKIQFLYVCILRRHVVTRKWLPHIWGSMAENFQRYIIKYSHSVVPGLYNWVLPPVHSQCWGESEKLDTEKQQTLYYQLQLKLTSKMNNNTIGYYSVIIQRSLLLLGGFRYLKESSWRPF